MDLKDQLKINLIGRIKNSNDLHFLKALQTTFNSLEQGFFELSPEQNAAISEGRKQIENGEFEENDVVISEISQWLRK